MENNTARRPELAKYTVKRLALGLIAFWSVVGAAWVLL